MAKPTSQYTDAELLALTQDEYSDSVRLEAIERGIKPPIKLSEALRSSEWRGYQKPMEAIPVWRFASTHHRSDFGYLTEAAAEVALTGVVVLEDRSWNNQGLQINAGQRPELVKDWVTTWKGESKTAKFEEYAQNDEPFDKVVEECNDRLSKVRQNAYNKRVRSEKRVEYLRLASGNEEIAKAFWAKTEGSEWPLE